MEPSIFSVFTQKLITTVITVGSMFYSSIDGVLAEFSPIDVSSNGSQLVVSTKLVNCFTMELDRILASGPSIYVHIRVELFEANQDKPIISKPFYNAISYSHLDQIYEVYQSHLEAFTSSLPKDRAKDLLVSFNLVPITTISELTPEKNYVIKISAWMDKIKLEGKENTLDLMYYWNQVMPVRTSNRFTLESLEQ